MSIAGYGTVQHIKGKTMELSNKSLARMGLAAILGGIAFGVCAVPVRAQMHGTSLHHSPTETQTDHLSGLDATQVSVNRWFNQGLEKLQAAKYEDAIEDFGQAIALNPLHEDAYVNRGNVYRKLGNYQGAIADYTQAIQLNPSFTYLYNSRGNIREELKDYKGAIADYTEAIRLYPEESTGYRNLGSVYYKLGDYQAALRSLNQAVQVNSGSAAAYLKRGEIYVKLDDCEKAINDFQQAINLFSAQGNAADSQRVNQLLRELQKQHPHLRTKP
jgi:tetratricopeptide (TPR) repeat protein